MAGLIKSLFRAQRESPAADEAKQAAAMVQAEKLKNDGNAHLQCGEFEPAAKYYRAAIQCAPRYAEAYNNLGNVLREQGRLIEAEATLKQAVALKPALGQAHYNLGLVASALGHSPQAIDCYQTALRLMPAHIDSHLGLGRLLTEQGRYPEANEAFVAALVLDARCAPAHVGIGLAQKFQENIPAAIASLEKALSINESAIACCFLGMIHHELNETERALEYYRRAHALDPSHHQTAWNLALLLLLLGDYAEGFRLFERRLSDPGELSESMAGARELMQRLGPERAWNGQSLPGKNCLVWTEQGLGDTLMMLRYLPLLRERIGGRIIVYCEAALQRLIRQIPAVDEALPKTVEIRADSFDVHCAIMSLPRLFDSRLETLPSAVPYLDVPQAMRDHWRERLGGLAGIKAGLVWGGAAVSSRHASRSITLTDMAPLAGVTGVSWVSLQKGASAAQAHEHGWLHSQAIDDCDDMLDTAALVANLDLVISIDTSVAHLAGALGKPVWLLHRLEGEWRWLLEREDSPWYPTMRLYRQSAEFPLESLVARMQEELRMLVARTDRSGY